MPDKVRLYLCLQLAVAGTILQGFAKTFFVIFNDLAFFSFSGGGLCGLGGKGDIDDKAQGDDSKYGKKGVSVDDLSF